MGGFVRHFRGVNYGGYVVPELWKESRGYECFIVILFDWRVVFLRNSGGWRYNPVDVFGCRRVIRETFSPFAGLLFRSLADFSFFFSFV